MKEEDETSHSEHSNDATAEQPKVRKNGKLSVIWFVPLLALALGLWLAKQHFDELGEVVTVTLDSAEGLSVGKTEVRCRAVKIGELESIALTEELGVELGLRIEPEYLKLLREDSEFWVVKARFSGGSISGLGTVLSGAYIELDPGVGEQGKRMFEGLENPPPTPKSVPGLRLELVTENPGSVDVGSGVFFKNSPVGKIEKREFDPEREEVILGIFIEEPYQDLITTNTFFWAESGLHVRVGPDGVDVELPSFNNLLSGQVAFGLMPGEIEGEEVADGFVYPLYANLQEAQANSFESEGEFLLLFEQSVRGLTEGAPVEFRGLAVGRVSEISYGLVREGDDKQTPVLIQLNKRLLQKHFPPKLLDGGGQGIAEALENGLRASLKSGNLLTGQRFVDLDYYPEEAAVALVEEDGYLVLPIVETGLGQLEERVTAVIDKVNNIPIESLFNQLEATTLSAQNTLQTMNARLEGTKPILAESQQVLAEMRESMASLNKLLEAESTQAIPDDLRKTLAQINQTLQPLSNEGAVYGDLRRTMDELRSATRSIERLADTIGDKPNSLLFGKPSASDKIPRAKR